MSLNCDVSPSCSTSETHTEEVTALNLPSGGTGELVEWYDEPGQVVKTFSQEMGVIPGYSTSSRLMHILPNVAENCQFSCFVV